MSKSFTIKKVFTILKIIVAQFTLVGVIAGYTLAEPVIAQELLKERINLNLKNSSLRAFLRTIEKQTDVVFSYQKGVIDSQEKLNLTIQNETVENILKQVLIPRRIHYRVINNNQIILNRTDVGKEGPGKTELKAENPVEAKNSPVDEVITGRVTDEKGEALPGVNVQIKGTVVGTATNENGNYTIKLGENEESLIFSFIGYKTKEVIVGNATVVNVALEADIAVLSEVLVVGYGTQSREKLTTSVSKVDNRVLKNIPYANAASALQGSVSGVRVQTTTGQPGAAPRIIVRGGTSINNPNGATPLYIVDGVIRSDMDNINADDIQSMQVLKDAASTSIYGARGSNGVVVITTKSGKAGSATITYKYNLISSETMKTYDLIPARDFIKFYRMGVMATAKKIPARMSLLTEASPGGTGNDLTAKTNFTTMYLSPENEHKLKEGWESMPDPLDPSKTIIFKDTDFQKMLYRNGISHNHALSMSGGSEKATYNLGLGYLNNQGIAYGTDYKRLSLNLNSEYKIRENLTTFGRLLYSKAFYRGETWAHDRGQAVAPTQKYLLEDGTLAPGGQSNPQYYENSQDIRNQKENLSMAVGARWDILPGLQFQPQLSLFKYSTNNRFFQKGAYLAGPAGAFTDSRVARGSRTELIQYQADAVFSYDKVLAPGHNLSAQAGFAYFFRENNALLAQGQGAGSDLIPTLNAATTPVSVSGTESFQLIMGYFGRVNYDYEQKYLLSLTARHDGASNLGNSYKWGFFPGVSAGWNVHKEDFWQNVPVVSELKLRGSYGVNGNISGLGDYQAQGEYGVGARYSGNSVVINTILANPDLQWERSATRNLGLDVSLFKNRIRILSDFYIKETTNLLTSLPLPFSTGFTSVVTNLGSLQNKGVEVEVSAQILSPQSPVKWEATFNASKVTNKILKLPNNGVARNRIGGYYIWDASINDYSWQGGLQEGGKLGEMFGYKQKSIYTTDEEAAQGPVDMLITLPDRTKFGGDVNWEDFDKNNIIDTRDRTYMGNMFPTWTGGFGNYVTYKNFSLNLRMDYTVGHMKHNWSRALIMGQYGTISGIVTDVYRSWQNPGDVTDIPRYYWGEQTVHRNLARENARLDGGNSIYYERGDFLALRELTLSYSFPKLLIRKLNVSNLNVYATGNNLHYFTKYRGLSPEDGGMDLGGYPPARNFIFGVTLSF